MFGHLLSVRAEVLGTSVHRVAAATIKSFRDQHELTIDDAHKVLVMMWATQDIKTNFNRLEPRHRDQIRLAEVYRLFINTQRARIACELRLYQKSKREAYTRAGETTEFVALKDLYEEHLANDKTHEALLQEEKKWEKEAMSVMQGMSLYTQILENTNGVGVRIALRFLANIPDIKAFPTKAKFQRFCGVTPNGPTGKKLQPGEIPPFVGGVFIRKRRGQTCDYRPPLRQALYLLADQMNRRPGSWWGAKFIDNKKRYREKHPEAIQVEVDNMVKDPETGKMVKDGTKLVWRYNNGHIHNMAGWKTLHQFAGWFWFVANRLEDGENVDDIVAERAA
jgi:hypothetical protein